MLRAGSAMIDITPPAGTHLGGTWGIKRGAETVADRLFARAVVMECAGRKICFAAPDLEICTKPHLDRIRAGVEARCGIAPGALMLHLPQIHSTPPLGHFLLDDELPNIPPEHEYLRGSETAYCNYAVDAIIDCIVRADRALVPVKAAAGCAMRDDLAFNRRGVDRHGKVVMPWLYSSREKPLGPVDIRYLEGPMDPEVGVFCLRGDDCAIHAMLLHYTCHPVNVFARVLNVVSADWCGAWCGQMQTRHGGVPLVMNGCCGNINPWPAYVADFQPDHVRMGRELGNTANAVLETLRFADVDMLDWRSRTVRIPIKQAPAEARRRAEEILDTHPTPRWSESNPAQAEWEWMDAAMLMSVELERERTGTYAYEIQAFRVGETALVGLPGEPFVEGQLAIKIASPAYHTFVAHCTGDYAGYIAPRDAYARGGHEIRDLPAKWAKLEPGALETIVAETGALLKELFV